MNALTPLQRDFVARAMRDAVMEQETSDENWQDCGKHWNGFLDTFQAKLGALGVSIVHIDLARQPDRVLEPPKTTPIPSAKGSPPRRSAPPRDNVPPS